MLRKADEGKHHTPEQVSEALAEALRICEVHDLEPPERATIAAALVGHLLSKQVVFEHVDATGVLLNRHN